MSDFKANKIDHKNLQPLSKNSPQNQKILGENSDVCKTNIEILLDNMRRYLLSTDACNCSSLLISENNWFFKRGNARLKGKDGLVLPLNVGQMVQVDFGKDYDVETGLIHYGLILKIVGDKVLIIPTTTSSKEIARAFHPVKSKSGSFQLRIGLTEEGFSKTVALYINDIKCISIGRLIPYQKVEIIKLEAYNSIREHVLRLYFADMFKDYSTKLKELSEENLRLRTTIEKAVQIVVDK